MATERSVSFLCLALSLSPRYRAQQCHQLYLLLLQLLPHERLLKAKAIHSWVVSQAHRMAQRVSTPDCLCAEWSTHQPHSVACAKHHVTSTVPLPAYLDPKLVLLSACFPLYPK